MSHFESGDDVPQLPLRAGKTVVPDPEFFTKLETIACADIDARPDLLRQIFERKRHGVIVKQVFEPAFMHTVAARLEGGEIPFPETHFPSRFKAHFKGQALDGSGGDLNGYLNHAATFRIGLAKLFGDGPDFEQRIVEVMSRMSGGRTVEVPRGPDGRAYPPSTIRVLPEGGQIATHCGNEATTRASYEHLNTLVDTRDQLSFFVMIQPPKAGGELVVYAMEWHEVDETMFVHGHTVVDPYLHHYQERRLSLEAGDMIVFDGGRYFHRVTKVEGDRTRWTVGGFLMFSKDERTIHFWS